MHRSAEERLVEGWLPAAWFTSVVARATKSPLATWMNLLPGRTVGTGPLVTFCLVRLFGPSVCRFQNSRTSSTGENFSLFRHPLAVPLAVLAEAESPGSFSDSAIIPRIDPAMRRVSTASPPPPDPALDRPPPVFVVPTLRWPPPPPLLVLPQTV